MSEHEIERRAFVECRVGVSESGKRLEGYAVVFNSLSVDLGGFREQIAPEAVDRTLQGDDVRALVDHDSAKILGRTRAGTLTLQKQTRGLFTIIEPDLEISYAKDLIRSVQRGDITGMSFGFRVIEDDWQWDQTPPLRTVLDMRMSEVSIVTFPAYQATDVSVAQRSLRAFQDAQLHSGLAWHRKRLQTARAK